MRVKTMSQAILLLGLIVAPCLAIAAEPTFKRDGSRLMTASSCTIWRPAQAIPW